MLKFIRSLYDYTLSFAQKPLASLALFVLAFIESSFFIVPPDVLLIALAVARVKKSFFYALICSIGSVLGGAFGFVLGYWFYDSIAHLIIDSLNLNAAFTIVGNKYQENVLVSVLVAAFTPIPYKVFTIAAGFFKVSFLEFILASIIGRSARFFLVALLIYFFGPAIKEKIEKYFDLLAILFTVLLLIGFLLVRFL